MAMRVWRFPSRAVDPGLRPAGDEGFALEVPPGFSRPHGTAAALHPLRQIQHHRGPTTCQHQFERSLLRGVARARLPFARRRSNHDGKETGLLERIPARA